MTFHIDWTPDVDYIGYYVAEEKGFYREAGFDVTIVPGNGANQACALIGEGKIEIGTTTVDEVIKYQRAASQDTKVDQDLVPVAVAVVFVKNPVALVSPAATPIDSIADIKSLAAERREPVRVGYSDETSVTYQQFRLLAGAENLVLSKGASQHVDLVPVQWSGPQKLIDHEVDAVLAYVTDVPVELAYQKFPYHEMLLQHHGMKMAGQCLAVQRAAASKQEKWLEAFVDASIRGWEYARANPEEATGLLVRRFPELNRDKSRIRIEKTLPLLPEKPLGPEKRTPYTSIEALRHVLEETERRIAEVQGLEPRKDAAREVLVDVFPEMR